MEGIMGKIWDYMKERLGAIPSEVGDMVVHKTAQGAAEISQALNSQSNAYVPYGVGQQPLEVEGPQQSYQDVLREASQRGGQEQDLGMDR
jgi:arginine utilization protein RocB